MKNNQFDIFFEELSDEFENRIDRLKISGHFEDEAYEPLIDQCRKNSQNLVEQYKNGYYINDKGKRTNDKGELIDKTDKKNARVNMSLSFREKTMDAYVEGKHGDTFLTGNTQNYLPLSFVCYQWGMHQYRNGEHAKGRRFLIKSLSFINMWAGAKEASMFMKQEEQYKKDKINAAREGGKGRAKSYEQLKAKVVELLNKHVPEGRWKTKTAAIDALQNDITQFIEDENIKISWHRAITDWSRNDNVIKAAFDKVVKKK